MISKNIMWVPLKKNKTLPWTNILDVIYNMSFSSLKLQKKKLPLGRTEIFSNIFICP